MKKKPLHFKQISYEETHFYWFKIGDSMYALYDSDMGEPISYGAMNFVVGTIRAINKEVREGKRTPCIVWYFERDGLNGWKKKTPPVLMDWTPESMEKIGMTQEKKKEGSKNRIVQ